MRNLKFCISELEKGGYIAEYVNYPSPGNRGALAGTGLQNKDGRCLITDCRAEFINLRDRGLITPVKWREGPYSGTEWYWKGDKNGQ